MLAHGITMPEVYEGAVLAPEARFEVYDTHVTVVPEDRDPWQVPLGTLTGVREEPEPPGITCNTRGPNDARRLDGSVMRACNDHRAARRAAAHAGRADGRGWLTGGARPTEVRDYTGCSSGPARRSGCRAPARCSAAIADPRIGRSCSIRPRVLVRRPLPATGGVPAQPVGAGTVLEMLRPVRGHVCSGEDDVVNRDPSSIFVEHHSRSEEHAVITSTILIDWRCEARARRFRSAIVGESFTTSAERCDGAVGSR
jgi:hypothetical protein